MAQTADIWRKRLLNRQKQTKAAESRLSAACEVIYNLNQVIKQLFLRQKALPEQFLKTGAISRAQYEKSLGDLTLKMGYGD